MTTLNSFPITHAPHAQLTAEDRALIADFFARGGSVTHYQPSAGTSEMVRTTRERVAKARRAFRASRKSKEA